MSKISIECDYCAGRGYEGIETGGVDYDGENDTREMVYSPCPQCLGNGRFDVDIDEAPELVQSFSRELYDIWQEAKSSTEDNWDDVEYDILSVTHRREYEKTAKRMLAQVSEFLQERMK